MSLGKFRWETYHLNFGGSGQQNQGSTSRDGRERFTGSVVAKTSRVGARNVRSVRRSRNRGLGQEGPCNNISRFALRKNCSGRSRFFPDDRGREQAHNGLQRLLKQSLFHAEPRSHDATVVKMLIDNCIRNLKHVDNNRKM